MCQWRGLQTDFVRKPPNGLNCIVLALAGNGDCFAARVVEGVLHLLDIEFLVFELGQHEPGVAVDLEDLGAVIDELAV